MLDPGVLAGSPPAVGQPRGAMGPVGHLEDVRGPLAGDHLVLGPGLAEVGPGGTTSSGIPLTFRTS